MTSAKIALIALLSSVVSGSALLPRQCVDTCGSTCYYQSDIDEAVNQGCSYYQRGQTVGSGSYPHIYNDYEGFQFPEPKPYYEFPILNTYKPYTGGSPGADRVIFDDDCDFQGLITHTGADGHDFLQCRK